jgi:hypothetical protein
MANKQNATVLACFSVYVWRSINELSEMYFVIATSSYTVLGCRDVMPLPATALTIAKHGSLLTFDNFETLKLLTCNCYY